MVHIAQLVDENGCAPWLDRRRQSTPLSVHRMRRATYALLVRYLAEERNHRVFVMTPLRRSLATRSQRACSDAMTILLEDCPRRTRPLHAQGGRRPPWLRCDPAFLETLQQQIHSAMRRAQPRADLRNWRSRQPASAAWARSMAPVGAVRGHPPADER